MSFAPHQAEEREASLVNGEPQVLVLLCAQDLHGARARLDEVPAGVAERPKATGVAQPKTSCKPISKACPQASASSQAPAPASPSSARDFSLEVPVLINDKVLDESTELVVYRQHKRQGPATVGPVKLTKIMRKK